MGGFASSGERGMEFCNDASLFSGKAETEIYGRI